MDLVILGIGIVLVSALIAIGERRTCQRIKAGYTCRRTYKNYCEGCQPAREAKRGA